MPPLLRTIFSVLHLVHASTYLAHVGTSRLGIDSQPDPPIATYVAHYPMEYHTILQKGNGLLQL